MRTRMRQALMALSVLFCAVGVARATYLSSGLVYWSDVTTPNGCAKLNLMASIESSGSSMHAYGYTYSLKCSGSGGQYQQAGWIHVTTGIYINGSWCGDVDAYNNTTDVLATSSSTEAMCGGNPSGNQTWRSDVGGEFWTGNGYSGWYGWQNSPNLIN